MAHQAERAVGLDPEHRDLVAAGIHRDHEPAAGRELQRALRGQPGSGPGPAGHERGSGHGGQRAVRVPVKRPDRVGSLGVVVDIDVPGHRGRIRRGGGGRRDRCGGRRGDAERQRRRPATGQEAHCSWFCMFGAGGRPRAPRGYKHHLLPFPPAKPDPVSGTRPPRWFAHHVFVADRVEVCLRPASGRQQAGQMMQARELCVPVSPPRRVPRPAMTDKMLLHPGARCCGHWSAAAPDVGRAGRPRGRGGTCA